MDRRTFLIGSAMAAGALTSQTKTKPAQPDANRRVYDLNRKWLFGGKAPAGSSQPAFDDSKWERVTLPHTNVRLPWHAFEEFKGGYTPFSFEITPHLKFGADNVLAVEVHSTERKDIPPFGENIDYLTFGGIYRNVSLRVVPTTFIENVHVRTLRPLEESRALAVRCYLNGPVAAGSKLTAELRDGERVLKSATITLEGDAEFHEVMLESLGAVELWDAKHPKLYTVEVRLGAPSGADRYSTRIGIREAKFTPEGFRSEERLVGKECRSR